MLDPYEQEILCMGSLWKNVEEYSNNQPFLLGGYSWIAEMTQRQPLPESRGVAPTHPHMYTRFMLDFLSNGYGPLKSTERQGHFLNSTL